MVFVKPVPDTDKHRITLISLYGFQILDKEVLSVFRTHQRLDIRIFAEQKFNLMADNLLLAGGERGNTQCLVRESSVVLNNRLRNHPRLTAVDTCFTTFIHRIRQINKGETKIRRFVHWGREDHEVTVIELLVGDRNQ